jgi:Domain of unknown function (DUF5642)
MRLPRTLLALASAVAIGACTSTPAPPPADIGKILSAKSTFGPDFKVQTIDKTAIDPKLLSPLQFQQGIKWEPPDCAQYAWTLPSGLKGNIASVSAEGEGNRFIAMGLETSEPVRYDAAVVDKCRHVTFGGPDVRGVVDVIDAPHIDGVQTLGKHRELHTATASGELYTYVAYLDTSLVVVTANPLPAPNQPVPPVNVQRAQQLLTDSVAAVRG